MKIRWNRWDTLIVILASVTILFAWSVYQELPDQIPTHFGPAGKPDNYSDKSIFIPMMGALVLLLPFLIKWLPLLDPRRENYQKFGRFYDLFRLSITLFLGGTFVAVLLYARGYSVNISTVTCLGLGLLWMVLGNYMGQVRPNWLFGIKLPWTLENDEVWRKTHRFAGPLWVGAGVLMLFAAWLPGIWAFWVSMVLIGSSSVLPAVYAYWTYRNMKSNL
jgi:uncharacterized membrane protein